MIECFTISINEYIKIEEEHLSARHKMAGAYSDCRSSAYSIAELGANVDKMRNFNTALEEARDNTGRPSSELSDASAQHIHCTLFILLSLDGFVVTFSCSNNIG